ncbi:MAG: hypothetical protein JWP11_3352 [Frankiales bacterium]|nr:hypothetical protein [Frankiales bacterium]
MSGELTRRDDVGDLVARLSDDDLDRRERGRLLFRLGGLLATGARLAGARAALSGKWLSEAVADVAPHVPVRDLLTLRQHHGGRSGDDLAEAMVSAAARTTAAIGAAGGALASAEMAAPPALLAAPVQLAAETLAVVAVELKLVAELHVVYGRAPVGTRAQLATAYLMSWATKRGIDLSAGSPSLTSVLGTAARSQLRSRVLRRLGRNVTTMAPFFAGAVAGAELNRRETRSLGDKLRADLRRAR